MSIITHIIFVIGSATSTVALWFRRLLWEPSRYPSPQRDTSDRPTPTTPAAEDEGIQEYRSRMTAMADAELRAERDAANAEEVSYRGQLRGVIREADAWPSQFVAMDADRLLGAHSYTRPQGRNAFATSPERIPALRAELGELVRHDKNTSTATSRQVIAMLAAKIVFAQSLSDDRVELAVVNHAAAQRLINFHGEDGPGPDPTGAVGDVGHSGSLPFHLDADAVVRREEALRYTSGSGDAHSDGQAAIDPHGVAAGFTAPANTSTAYNPAMVQRGHDEPGMRLPSRNRTIFLSGELFEQQRDMQRHDHGLQSVLVALHAAVSRIIDEPVELGDYDFTMNFAQATSVTTKRYSVRMRHPIVEQLDLVQRMEADTMTVRWTVVRNGTETFFDPNRSPEMVFQDGHHPAGREQRVITLDDEEDNE